MRRVQYCKLFKTTNCYRSYANEKAKTSLPNYGNAFGAQYCLNLVEKHDYENYLCTLLLGKENRRQAFALRAFNVEVAKCGSNISESSIAKMRLKFWHDSIDKCYETEHSYVTDQPVLRELKETLNKKKLNKVYLKRLVTARDRPTNQQFESIRELEDYAEQTCSSLYHLLVELTGVRDIQVDHAASHLGKAQGITTMLRAIPHIGRSGQAINIPLEVLIRHGVSQERILRDQADDKGVEECVFEVASAANQHLEMARELTSKVPKEIRKLFLPAVTIGRYLERLRVSSFRLTSPNCIQRDSMLPVALYKNSLFGKY